MWTRSAVLSSQSLFATCAMARGHLTYLSWPSGTFYVCVVRVSWWCACKHDTLYTFVCLCWSYACICTCMHGVTNTGISSSCFFVSAYVYAGGLETDAFSSYMIGKTGLNIHTYARTYITQTRTSEDGLPLFLLLSGLIIKGRPRHTCLYTYHAVRMYARTCMMSEDGRPLFRFHDQQQA